MCSQSSCTGNGWRISDEEAALPAQVVGHQGVARTRDLESQGRLLIHILPGGIMNFCYSTEENEQSNLNSL
jgi:hypothetical protein